MFPDLGLHILRFPNNAVVNNPDDHVVKTIPGLLETHSPFQKEGDQRIGPLWLI